MLPSSSLFVPSGQVECDHSTANRLVPLKLTPRRSAPVKLAPVRLSPAKLTPSRSAPVRLACPRLAGFASMPASLAPFRSAPWRSAPRRSVPWRSARLRSVPLRSVPDRSAPWRSAPWRSAFVRSKLHPRSWAPGPGVQLLVVSADALAMAMAPATRTTKATTRATPSRAGPTRRMTLLSDRPPPDGYRDHRNNHPVHERPRSSPSSASASPGSVTLIVCIPSSRAGLRFTPRSSRNTASSARTSSVSQASS